MALTTQQREDGWQWVARNRAPAGVDSPAKWTKDDLRAALDAATTWIEANAASSTAALSATNFGANSTTDEKVRLFVAALTHKYGVTV